MTKQYNFADTEDIRFKTIIDLISLATGLDLAISSIKKEEISYKAIEELRQLIFQSYALLANKQAISVLQDKGLISPEDNLNKYHIVIDTPDNDHSDIIIEYFTKL